MENLLCNRLPVPIINIKDADDCIIEEINTTISNSEIVNDWDVKNSKKIKSKLSVCENEKVLEDVLKDYIRILREQALHFREKNVLKEKIFRHVKVFYMYYTLNDGIPMDISYLDYMEKILIFLCNLELEVIRRVKKKDKDYNKKIKEVAQNLIRILGIYLLNKEQSILHVLLRLDSRRDSQSWKDIMHIVYRYYLITLPVKDRSEECFCRNFLLFQKWKSITEKTKHVGMDKIMYFRFSRTPETEVTNPTLRTILNSDKSIVNIIDVLSEDRRTDIDNYFKYIDEKDREDDVCLPQSINLDSEEEEDSIQRLEFVQTERDKRCNGLIKSEKPAQENVHYVEVPANNGQVVCIIDDDSDVEEVGVQVNNKNRRKLGHKYSPTQPVISFLDSILIPDDDANSSINTSSSTPTCSAEEVTLTSLVKNSSPSTLPLLTTYLNYMRSKGSIVETNVQENEESSTVTNMESLSIADTSPMEVQTDTGPPTSVESASEVITDVPSEKENVQSEHIGVDTNEIGVSPVNNNQLPLNETQQTKNSDDSIKCSCSCKCSLNRNSGNTQNDTNNKSAEQNYKTVKIQTEGVENFSFICGFITPPSSDRTSDETSPESIENICAGQQHTNLNDNNSSTYTYVPNMAICDTDTGNSSPNQYESEGEIHNYPGVCDTSTQISTFNEPEPHSNEDQNNNPEENITEHHIEITDVNVNTPEQTSDEQESPESFNVTSPEVQEQTELVSEIEVNEVMIPPVESYDDEQDNQGSKFEQSDGDAQEIHEEYEILNVTEPISTPNEQVLIETENNETYTHLNGMPVIVAEPQGIENLDGEANSFVIPMDVILDNYEIPESGINNGEKSAYQPYVANAEIVLVQNISKEDALFNKLSVFRKIEEEATSQNNQLNNNNHKINDNIPNFTVNKILSSPEKLSTKLNTKSGNCKIQASVSMAQLIKKPNVKPQPVKKLNGNNVKHDKNKSVSLEEKQKQDKIMYTSNERVSAPLSVFAQFEQSQSDLVEKALSGPIEPMNNKPSINSDNSNSNDSFYLFESNQFSPSTEQHKQNNRLGCPEESSPVSPPYEDIHAQEFQSHIISLESLAPKPKTLAETVISANEENNETVDKRDNRLNNIINVESLSKSPVNVVSKSTSKRKHVEETASPTIKKPRVNFGSTEVRIIPREQTRLISNEIIEEARESMEEYKISANDRKLLYLQPQVPVKNDTPTELQEKEKQMRLQHAIIQSLLSAKKYNLEKTCIVKRVDYKKPLDENVPLNSSSTRSLENSISPNFMHPIGGAILNSTSKRMETASLSNFTPPSGYIPPLNSYEAACNIREPLVEEVQVSSGTTPSQNNIQNTPCNKLSNERFNDLLDQCNAEILNLSVNSKSNTPTTEINVPESEFSRSPKFLQNPDQIVQQCLIDNLENTEADPALNVNNNITFLSNNSNFYTTGSQFKPAIKPPEESFSCPLDTADSKCSIDDDLLLKREIDKMIDEKIKNFESETCLPFKKRRVPTVTVKPSSKTNVKYQPAKEEISYPATPMISIAEIEALQQNERANNRSFKTPAERKEMPPLPVFYNLNSTDPSPIITDQFNINNHTYNNPTINYHMSNVPMPFINVPCASYYSLPPILLPFNNLHTFDSAVNQNSNAYNNDDQVTSGRIVKKEKKEKRKRSKKEKHYSENYYPDYKKSDSKTV